MNSTIIQIASKEANKSTCRHKIGAVIFKGNKVISRAHNEYRRKRNLHPRYKRFDFSLHAEQSAILKARCDLRRASIFVLRLNKHGEFLLAKPCEYCQAYLEQVGVTHIYYTYKGGICQLEVN